MTEKIEILNGRKGISENKDLFKKVFLNSSKVSANESRYYKKVQGFIDFLSRTGNVEISENFERVINYGKTKEGDYEEAKRLGVFVDKNLIGFLDFYKDEIWYQGEVPGAVSHLNTKRYPIEKSIYPNAPFVRMIYRTRDKVREDKWSIPF